MPEQQITGFPVRAAPNSRVTKDSESFELLAVNATFDGSGTGSDFLPAVEVVSDSGVVVARHVTDATVTAGDSAEVTFAPFLRRTAPGGIRFDVPNVGGYLSVQTTGAGPSGYSQTYIAGSAGFLWQTPGAGTFDFDGGGSAPVNWDVGAYTVNTNGGTYQVDTGGGGAQFVNGPFEADGNGQDHRIFPQGGATRINGTALDGLSFFGHAPATQQATPVTLGDVIAILRAYGLAA